MQADRLFLMQHVSSSHTDLLVALLVYLCTSCSSSSEAILPLPVLCIAMKSVAVYGETIEAVLAQICTCIVWVSVLVASVGFTECQEACMTCLLYNYIGKFLLTESLLPWKHCTFKLYYLDISMASWNNLQSKSQCW